MFCQNCGTKNDDNVKFCSNFGNLINSDFINIKSENNDNKKNDEFKHSSNFGRIKTQIDSIKDQPNTGFTDEEINKLSKLINDDEDILYFISGFDSFGNDSLLVVFTSKRVIIAKWIIFNSIEEKKSIPLENINRVSSSIGGIMGEEVIIEHGNNAEYINNVGKESGKLFEYKINKELEKYHNKSEKSEKEENSKDTQNHNLNNVNSIEKNNINLHRTALHRITKDRYLFLKNRYVNCSSIQEIKREENSILIMTSKNVYYLKYSDDRRALDNYNKLISFITDEVFEIEDDEEK
ncbi:PH domain-containing protein [uncultured Brachyspira sp.]|uniref:PH domain-containing protein n=1 Tax=uncultured Brachyspira sp. TaxID=221953 RepID=UPI0025D63597|nr:PH domain-containing protein [uncultured Brachyspira sp.]